MELNPVVEGSLGYNSNITRSENDPIGDWVVDFRAGVSGVFDLTEDNGISYGVSFSARHYLNNPELSTENKSTSVIFVPEFEVGLDVPLTDFIRLSFDNDLSVSRDATNAVGRDEEGNPLANLANFNRLTNLFRAGIIWDLNARNSLSLFYNRTDLYPFDDFFEDTQRTTEQIVLNWRHIYNEKLVLNGSGGYFRTRFYTDFGNPSDGYFLNGSADVTLTDLINLNFGLGYNWSDTGTSGLIRDLSGDRAGTGWDGSVSITHAFNSIMAYALSYSRAIDYGFLANTTTTNRLSLNYDWQGFLRSDLNVVASYDWGEDSGGQNAEEFERFYFRAGLDYQLGPDLRADVSYNYTRKWSNIANRSYEQHLFEVSLTYSF